MAYKRVTEKVASLAIREGYTVIVYRFSNKKFIIEGPYFQKEMARKHLAQSGYKESSCSRDVWTKHIAEDIYSGVALVVSILKLFELISYHP